MAQPAFVSPRAASERKISSPAAAHCLHLLGGDAQLGGSHDVVGVRPKLQKHAISLGTVA